MGITAQQVKELRDKTSAGMMDCKRALTETDGDIEAAADETYEMQDRLSAVATER